ncbi:hypothetical protein CK203_032867 [Vitis vinifera]|uniref:Uncharacterized protein n=1 Tax=Vitis vinifera TaxID=29760 RepID=A0A438HL52_VITVI|nr:hypothetical protein CK203_032867 [Vitis vinifera]
MAFWGSKEETRPLTLEEQNARQLAKKDFKNCSGLTFDVLGDDEAVLLEVLFFEVEVFKVLLDLNGDKAPGLDDFSLDFWQFNWDFVKDGWGWRVSGRGGKGVDVSHLLLKVNLEKSELIPVGSVKNVDELAQEFRCKCGGKVAQKIDYVEKAGDSL